VHGWTRSGRWHPDYGPTNTDPVPPGTNWDLWLGPRAERPYSPKYTPVTWRDYWAFGGGPFADMACHNLDAPFWALDLAAPLTIEASCGAGLTEERVPSAAIYRYTFGPRGDLPPLNLTWYDGGLRPATPATLEDGEELGRSGNGNLFIGDKGALTCPGWGGPPRLIPLSRMESFQRPPKTLPRAQGHHKDWLAACKGGPQASASFDYGAQLTEMILLGGIALRLGKKLQWDAPAMKFTNAPEADVFLKGQYRPGWEIA
jgi:predicted dehydrogenase